MCRHGPRLLHGWASQRAAIAQYAVAHFCTGDRNDLVGLTCDYRVCVCVFDVCTRTVGLYAISAADWRACVAPVV